MLGLKHLKTFLVNHSEWTQGNNLQETEIIVSLIGDMLIAESICRNGLGSVFTTDRTLNVECPSCFLHLFTGKFLVIDL